MIALLLVVSAAASLLLLPRSDDGLLGLPDLAVGAEAPRTIKSPRAFAIEDPETTERLRTEALGRERPTYDLFMSAGADAKERIESAFLAARGEEATSEGKEKRSQAFMLALGTTLDGPVVGTLLAANNSDELQHAAIMVAQAIYERRIVGDKALLQLRAPNGIQLRLIDGDGGVDREENIFQYGGVVGFDEARAEVDEIISERLMRLRTEARRCVAHLVKRILRPNVVLNEVESELRRLAAERAVKMVVMQIPTGETILRKGDRISQRHLFILNGMERELRQESRLQASLGAGLLVFLLVIITYRFARLSNPRFLPSQRDVAFLATVFLAVLLIMFTGYKGVLYLVEAFPLIDVRTYRFAIPVAAGVLLVRIVLGMTPAVAFGVMCALTAGWMMDVDLGYAAYATAGCLAASSSRSFEKPRTATLLAGLRVGCFQAVVILALALLSSNLEPLDLVLQFTAALVSGMLSAIVCLLLLPAAEVVFGYTSALKLNDLANLNHPLLRALLVEAPGTYRHSVVVGTMAEAAARAIGVDPLLVRVGAYYHDIGKLKNPRSFDENGDDGFTAVAPIDHAHELKMHVADGLELAGKHRLGQAVMEMIAQHHGRSLVRRPAQQAAELGGPEDPQAFRYDGPSPLTREAALVMLADVCEVATRDLADQVPLERSRIDARLRDLVNEILSSGELERCDLTMRELGIIIKAFGDVLEDSLIRRTRTTFVSLPSMPPAAIVRAPGGEPN